MTVADQVKPGMPWLPTKKEKSQKFVSFLLALIASVVLLFVTGLNGKLGWVFAFFISYVSISVGARLVGESGEYVRALLHVHHHAQRFAKTAPAGQFGSIERERAAVAGDQQNL